MKTARLRRGTLASLAGLAALIMLSADVQMYFWSQDMYCENGDRDGCIVPAPQQSPITGQQGRRFDANGNAAGFVISSRTGARARVGIRYAARFQAYIDDLENNHGARVLFMGGVRPGSCSPSSEHPCGKALDVCQLRRGVVDPRCKLPARAELGRIAASHGLFEGGRWCNSDYGHAQVDATRACGESRNRITRKKTAKQEQVAQNMPTLTASD
jgi:D-alanyl-D-alanine carboxypeptidase